ncbi:hypothetical protein [Chondromyces apiculatus]|uniref:Uncharacterized protein n=1 Tax=Chondromyces apiculatus DSM 436 TaxID=1192034 RepID=A0A017ST39_9BACT|nr:hypothetical protein [Chondromyces apiculatus]EYF00153.1 Hypothetical protein CAP_1140 [Chondromyces apiculatus DSM 436]
MINRLLVALPVVLVAALAGGAAVVDDPAGRDALTTGASYGVKLFGAAGALAAALAFERGDYLRRAWGLQALYMLLLARDAVLRGIPAGSPVLGVQVELVDGVVVIVANVAGVAAAWMMARAWAEAGFEMPAPRWQKLLVGGVALGVAVGCMGAPLVHDIQALAGGDLSRIKSVVSTVADMASTSLIAPVLLTVLAMRGGILVWPWGMFAASMVCWLVFDAGSLVIDVAALRASGSWTLVAWEGSRVLACGFAGAAGLAQRVAIRSPQLVAEVPLDALDVPDAPDGDKASVE